MHRVKKGESLFSISKKYRVDTKTLRELNSLRGNSLSSGKLLKVKPKGE
jgi:LysM repeat protein